MLLTRSPLSRRPKPPFALDLHVLGTPPALILSQDQTLQLNSETSEETPEKRGCRTDPDGRAERGSDGPPQTGKAMSASTSVRRHSGGRPEVRARAAATTPRGAPGSTAVRSAAEFDLIVRKDLSSLARLSSLCLVEKEPRRPAGRKVSLSRANSRCQVRRRSGPRTTAAAEPGTAGVRRSPGPETGAPGEIARTSPEPLSGARCRAAGRLGRPSGPCAPWLYSRRPLQAVPRQPSAFSRSSRSPRATIGFVCRRRLAEPGPIVHFFP